MNSLERKIVRYQRLHLAHDEAYIDSKDIQDLKESYYYKGRRDECIEKADDNQPVLTNKEKHFVVAALNFYWNDAHSNLGRKNLGELEKQMYEIQKEGAKKLIDKLD